MVSAKLELFDTVDAEAIMKCLLFLTRGKYEGSVACVADGVYEGVANFFLSRKIWNVVEITFRVRILVVYSWWNA